MNATRTIVPGLLAGALLAGGASSTFAAKARQGVHRAVLIGQVSNLSATSFTLTWTPRAAQAAGATTTPKSITVNIAATTKQRGLKGATTLANGDYAFVAGPRSSGAVTANRVVYSATAFTNRQVLALRGLLVRGTVLSSTAGSLTLSVGQKARTMTFVLNSATKFRANKQVSTTAPSFTAGEKVVVRFARGLNTATKTVTLTAKVVAIPAKQS